VNAGRRFSQAISEGDGHSLMPGSAANAPELKRLPRSPAQILHDCVTPRAKF